MAALQVLKVCVADVSDVQCYVQFLEWMENDCSALGATSPYKPKHNLSTFYTGYHRLTHWLALCDGNADTIFGSKVSVDNLAVLKKCFRSYGVEKILLDCRVI